MTARLDHLVVLADTLSEGVRWCEQVLGVTPDAGGKHPLMGTHNRLLDISGADFPQAYLEIIALDAGAPSRREGGLQRWFDMDDVVLLRQVERDGPQLIHWVAAVPDLAHTHALWRTQLGIDRGAILKASRPTPTGLLEWQITVRDDGQRLMSGCLPTLIQLGEQHPASSLKARGVQLTSLQLEHPDAGLIQGALVAAEIAAAGITTLRSPAPALCATLETPRGPITLNARPKA